MSFTTRTLPVRTGRTETVYDLTRACEAFLDEVADGADGLLNVFVPHATLPVLHGRLELGTWQSVVLVDTNRDNPDRTVRLSFLR